MGWLTGWFRRERDVEAAEADGRERFAAAPLSGEAPPRAPSRSGAPRPQPGGLASAPSQSSGGAAAAAAAGAVVVLGAEILHAVAATRSEPHATDPAERSATETGEGRHDSGTTSAATHDAVSDGVDTGRSDPGPSDHGAHVDTGHDAGQDAGHDAGPADDGAADAADGGDAGGDGGGD